MRIAKVMYVSIFDDLDDKQHFSFVLVQQVVPSTASGSTTVTTVL